MMQHFFSLTRLLSFISVLLTLTAVLHATVLPVGPITFSSDSDYDGMFKEPGPPPDPFTPPFNGIRRSDSGQLTLTGAPSGLAVFDSSATGGVGGAGGTNGGDANNDLGDIVISADFGTTSPGILGGGFLMRLDDNEQNGLLTAVHSLTPNLLVFEIFSGANLQNPGAPVAGRQVRLDGQALRADEMYRFGSCIAR